MIENREQLIYNRHSTTLSKISRQGCKQLSKTEMCKIHVSYWKMENVTLVLHVSLLFQFENFLTSVNLTMTLSSLRDERKRPSGENNTCSTIRECFPFRYWGGIFVTGSQMAIDPSRNPLHKKFLSKKISINLMILV